MGLVQPGGGGGTPFPGFAGVGVIAAETVGATALAGVSLLAPRGDHRHALLGSSPQLDQALTAASNAGVSGAPARFDHVHGFTGLPGVLSAVYAWDFALDGGATGGIPMRLIAGVAIPANAVIIDAAVDIPTTVTGGAGATGTIQIEAPGDLGGGFLLPFTAPAKTSHVSNIQFGYGNNFIATALASNDAIKTSVPRTPQMVFAVNPATAGKIALAVTYFVSAP